MTVQELIDELMKVEDKSRRVIYWHFGYREVDKVDDNELAVELVGYERTIGERSYLNENWIKADKSISEYPIGTKFKSINGGYWIKTERGYKWCTGATFPRVGGDYIGLVCLPEK